MGSHNPFPSQQLKSCFEDPATLGGPLFFLGGGKMNSRGKMNLSQLAWVWVAQKPWSYCSHSLCDSHVAHTEHSHSPGSLLVSFLRVLRAPESPGRDGRDQSEETTWERGAEPDPLRDAPVLKKASRAVVRGVLCWPRERLPREGPAGSSGNSRLLLGTGLESSVAWGSAELRLGAQLVTQDLS